MLGSVSGSTFFAPALEHASAGVVPPRLVDRVLAPSVVEAGVMGTHDLAGTGIDGDSPRAGSSALVLDVDRVAGVGRRLDRVVDGILRTLLE